MNHFTFFEPHSRVHMLSMPKQTTKFANLQTILEWILGWQSSFWWPHYCKEPYSFSQECNVESLFNSNGSRDSVSPNGQSISEDHYISFFLFFRNLKSQYNRSNDRFFFFSICDIHLYGAPEGTAKIKNKQTFACSQETSPIIQSA